MFGSRVHTIYKYIYVFFKYVVFWKKFTEGFSTLEEILNKILSAKNLLQYNFGGN